MDKKFIAVAVLALSVVMFYPLDAATAVTEYVYVDLYFNIGAVDELTVTLLGQSAVTSAPAGTATPANIEFNVSTDAVWKNASVTGGGSTQDYTNPILSLDNTGTTNLQINISLNETLNPGVCTMILRYINDSAPYDVSGVTPGTNGVNVTTTNMTVDSSFTPAEATWGLWLYANFSGCIDSDDTVKRFRIFATTV